MELKYYVMIEGKKGKDFLIDDNLEKEELLLKVIKKLDLTEEEYKTNCVEKNMGNFSIEGFFINYIKIPVLYVNGKIYELKEIENKDI